MFKPLFIRIFAVMIIASRYNIERIKGTETFRIRNLAAPLCPNCTALCSGYDNRLRRVIGDDGRVAVYRLRRLRCPACNTLHIELPDFMHPRKHYAAAVIDDVLAERGESCHADNTTIWRWRREKNHPPGLQCLSSDNDV